LYSSISCDLSLYSANFQRQVTVLFEHCVQIRLLTYLLLIFARVKAISHCREYSQVSGKYSRQVPYALTRVNSKAENCLCVIFCCCTYHSLVFVGHVT